MTLALLATPRPDVPTMEAGPDQRRRLYQALMAFPGLRLSELARQAGIGEDLARYHMRVMVQRGLAQETQEGETLRYYPKGESRLGPAEVVDAQDQRRLGVLRRVVPLRMVLALLAAPEGRLLMGELAREAGVSAPTATYHVRHLAAAGLVAVEPRHRERHVALADAAEVVRLLARYPPPRDMVAGFIELWDRLDL